MAKFPKQGTKPPWKLHQNYALDLMSLRYAKLDDGVLRFTDPRRDPAQEPARLAA
jgi:hypothetical protein